MKKAILLTVIMGIYFFLFCGLSEAKRQDPKNVRPLVYKGIKFIAHWSNGYVKARDIETNKEVWENQVYKVDYDPNLESDVQDQFITSLSIEAGKLAVVAEGGKKYIVDIPNNILKVTKNDEYYYLQPWDSFAPGSYYSYNDDDKHDRRLYWDSCKGIWVRSSAEKYPKAIQKAKQVLKEWGQNPEKYEYEEKQYDYEIYVSVSLHFISIIFNPVGLSVSRQHVEIRMTKNELKILSIEKGAWEEFLGRIWGSRLFPR